MEPALLWLLGGSGLGFRGDGGAVLGEEGFGEGFVEVEDFAEVVFGVGVLTAEHAFFDEDEYHFADVVAGADAPLAEKGGSHGAELLHGEVADSTEEFLATDVALFAVVLALAALDGEVEGVLEEEVGPGIVTLVALNDRVDGGVESESLHAIRNLRNTG